MESIAKDLIKAEDYDGAVAQLNQTIEVAGAYEATDVVEACKTLMPQVFLSKGNTLLKAKDVAGATAAFQEVLTLDPSNGMAALLLGSALTAQGKVAEAEAAYLQAAENGQAAKANQQLSKMYLKLAQASLKAKKAQDAYNYAEKANSFVEDANAYKIAASAAQQLSKNAECIANYEKYIALKPTAADAAGVKFTIAALYQQTGNKAKAKEYYQMVANDPQYGPSAQEQIKTL